MGSALCCSSAEPIVLGQWHSVKVSRLNQEGVLQLDGGPPIRGTSGPSLNELNLELPLYVGGVMWVYQFDDLPIIICFFTLLLSVICIIIIFLLALVLLPHLTSTQCFSWPFPLLSSFSKLSANYHFFFILIVILVLCLFLLLTPSVQPSIHPSIHYSDYSWTAFSTCFCLFPLIHTSFLFPSIILQLLQFLSLLVMIFPSFLLHCLIIFSSWFICCMYSSSFCLSS